MKTRYAELSELRRAIKERNVVRFTVDGRRYEAEPHLLDIPAGKGAMQLTAWIKPTDNAVGLWRKFKYSNLRDLEVEEQRFEAKHLPPSRQFAIKRKKRDSDPA